MALTDTTQRPVVRWTARQIAVTKPFVFLLSLYPVFHWVWLGFTDGLTANPPEFLIRSSGIWALVALALTLLVTPVRRLLKQPALLRYRRMLGLFAFFYSTLHVLGWAYWERNWSLASMGQDIWQRPFITVGVIAMVPMLLMALTSTHGWIRRLGRGWQRLHYAIYPIAVLSVAHFWLIRAGKNNFFEPYLYGAIFTLLLLYRVGHWLKRRSDRPAGSSPSAR